MNEPIVSVIVPSYNHEYFIIDCLESIVSQTYPHIELIIIDDGSTDSSALKIDKFVKSHTNFNIKFIARENMGLCNTLNEGLKLASGEFVVPFASDDVMKGHRLANQVDYLARKKETTGCFSGVTLIDETNKEVGTFGNHPGSYSFNDIFLRLASLPAPTAMLRRCDIERVGGYDPRFKIEDLNMWLKLTASGGTLDNIGGSLVLYRQHSQNSSSNHEVMLSETRNVLRQYADHALYLEAISNSTLVHAIDVANISAIGAARFCHMAIICFPKTIFRWKFYRSLMIIFARVFRRLL